MTDADPGVQRRAGGDRDRAGPGAAFRRGMASLHGSFEIGVRFKAAIMARPITSASSGGTLAGIAAGLRDGQRAIGFSALKGGEFLAGDVTRLSIATRTAYLVGKPAESRSASEVEELFGWWLDGIDGTYQQLAGRKQELLATEGAIKSRATIAARTTASGLNGPFLPP